MDKASALLQECNKAEADAATWQTLWQDEADYAAPRKSQITDIKTPDVEGYTSEIYDTEAIHAGLVLAAGQMDFMLSGRWFGAEAPMSQTSEAVKMWYKDCGERMLEQMVASNFYTVAHEFCHDRGIFGISHFHIEEDEDDVFYLTRPDVGTFFCRENHKGMVDTVYRRFTLCSDKAVMKWGAENVGKKVREDYENGSQHGKYKEFKFWHIVKPRPASERQSGKQDGINKPIASIYLNVDDKKIISESGYNEMPCVTSRYLKWGNQPYGYCPTVECLPTIKQRNFIERQMDALAEVTAFPRILVPSDLEEDPDLRASGITVFDPNNPQAKPMEWLTGGRYDIGKDRSEDKAAMIRRAYLVDLFQLLTQAAEMKREKTAYEVQKMLAEKLPRISPTFELMKHEVFRPTLTRIFSIMFRKGLFLDPPREAVVQTPAGETIPFPKINYTSKLAMAIKGMENQAFLEFMEMVRPMVEVYGAEVLNEINPGRSTRTLAENQGVPVAFLNSEEEKQAKAEAQAAQAQAAAALEAAEKGSKAISNIKGSEDTLTSLMGGRSRMN